MKVKIVDTEVLRAQAISILMALKTKQELEAALHALDNFRLAEVVGYEEDGTTVTKKTILADYHQDWKDQAEGRTISNAAMIKSLEEELGISLQH